MPKLIDKLMNFEENEEDGKNYSHILNQICYYSEVNQIEIIDEAGKPEIKDYLIDYYEYFDSVKSYNRNTGLIDTGEFFSLWFYLESFNTDMTICLNTTHATTGCSAVWKCAWPATCVDTQPPPHLLGIVWAPDPFVDRLLHIIYFMFIVLPLLFGALFPN